MKIFRNFKIPVKYFKFPTISGFSKTKLDGIKCGQKWVKKRNFCTPKNELETKSLKKRAALMFQEGSYEESKKLYLEAIKLGDTMSITNYAYICYGQGDIKEATEYFYKAIGIGDSHAMYVYANILCTKKIEN